MTVFLIVLALLALTTASLLATAMRRAVQAKRWPQHTARVVRSHVVRKASNLGGIYYVHVRYQYSADSDREASCILPSFLGTDQQGYAERLASFFRVGASVPVYVDPSHPERAILLPGIDQKEWLFLGLMIIVMIWAPIAAFLR